MPFARTPANHLLQVMFDGINGPKEELAAIPVEKLVNDLQEHLQWLKSRHVKKKSSEKYLIEICFEQAKSPTTCNEIRNYSRVNLNIAIKFFNNLIKNIKDKHGEIDRDILILYRDIIVDYILGLRRIAELLEKGKDNKYIFCQGYKISGIYSFRLLQLSKHLANRIIYDSESFDHKAASIASIFVLRQALEEKFKRIIAADIFNSLGKNPKLQHDFYYKFIRLQTHKFSCSDAAGCDSPF